MGAHLQREEVGIEVLFNGTAPLEDAGYFAFTANHFEKYIYGDEIMVADEVLDAKMSKMTLAVAEDSGWYEVDYGMADNFFWGKNSGCAVFNKVSCDSTKVKDFCPRINFRKFGCDSTHTYHTKCHSSRTTNYCTIQLKIKSCKRHHEDSGLEYHGEDASCLITRVKRRELGKI